MRLLPCGDAALLIQLDDLASVLALTRALEDERSAGRYPEVVELVPAARTVLLGCRPGPAAVAAVAGRLAGMTVRTGSTAAGAEVEIEVCYDGDDLAEVAALTGLDEAQVVRLHTAARWTVAFTGFAPGFGYLVGGDPQLAVPRRAEPRTTVPAGAVGLAGEFSGIYPRPSPGGWQLIGRTDARMWDADRDPPALLSPGTRVRFVEVS